MRCALPIRTSAAAAVLLLAAGIPAHGAADALRPAAGRLLVAARKQQQGVFGRSVVLLLDYDAHGAVGLIINHPTAFPLARLLPAERELRGRTDTVYYGGPVALDRLTLLVRSPAPPAGSLHVTGDVYATASMTALRAAAGDRSGHTELRAYAGYAGWGPGQLDGEIARGDWLVAAGSAELIFGDDPASLWRRLLEQRELKVVRLGRAERMRR